MPYNGIELIQSCQRLGYVNGAQTLASLSMWERFEVWSEQKNVMDFQEWAHLGTQKFVIGRMVIW